MNLTPGIIELMELNHCYFFTSGILMTTVSLMDFISNRLEVEPSYKLIFQDPQMIDFWGVFAFPSFLSQVSCSILSISTEDILLT